MSLSLAMSIVCFALGITILLVIRWRTHLERHPSSGPVAILRSSPAAILAPQRVPQQIRDLAFGKVPDWRFLVPLKRRRGDHPHTVAEIFDGARKPPLPAVPGLSSRPDWAYYNKDAGDLTDPYRQGPPSASRRATSGARKLY